MKGRHPYDPLLDPPRIPWDAVAFLGFVGALMGGVIGYVVGGPVGAAFLIVPAAMVMPAYILLRLLIPWWRIHRIYVERLKEQAERRDDRP